MPQDDVTTVLDRILHDGRDRFTLYQLTAHLDAWGEVGMARALRATCRDLEDLRHSLNTPSCLPPS